MLFRLILLFTLVPLAELWLLITISRYTTIAGTIGIVLVTGFAGAALARYQGWQTWRRLQEELRGGRPPADALLDGLMIFTAGVLMITPGVLTDAVGFALLLPPVRRLLKLRLRRWLTTKTTVQLHTFHTQSAGTTFDDGDKTIIDVEYTRTEEEETGRDTKSLPSE